MRDYVEEGKITARPVKAHRLDYQMMLRRCLFVQCKAYRNLFVQCNAYRNLFFNARHIGVYLLNAKRTGICHSKAQN